MVQRGTGYVLAGNHTLRAARELDWPEIDVVFVDVDDVHAHKIMLAANRTADLGEYDEQVLADLLSELPDFDGTGYDPSDLEDLLRSLEPDEEPDELTDPDDAPGLPKETVTAVGDVWVLGPHRLVVGDCTDSSSATAHSGTPPRTA